LTWHTAGKPHTFAWIAPTVPSHEPLLLLVGLLHEFPTITSIIKENGVVAAATPLTGEPIETDRKVTMMILGRNALRGFRAIAGMGLIAAILATGYCLYLTKGPQAVLMMAGAVTFGLALWYSRQWEPPAPSPNPGKMD